ncbi:MAG: HDOD domain-containing protein, partial [Thermodesulfobacteriota bacterium]|nr:HDOD domain-containing protein [Thermodesulfobacteriota bacterium]
ARQPIFNKNKVVYGYELLFREGMTNFFPDIDGDTATSKLLSNSFFSIGIEKIIGKELAFINFTQDLLLKRVPLMFPRSKVVVEILEDVEPEKDVLEVCREISRKGYHIALDDFFYKSELEPLIALAKIIKFDFRLTSFEDMSEDVKKLTKYNVSLLAEKVETHEEFNRAVEMGFKYFQGYFFSKPEIMKGKEISTPHINLLELMAEANREDFKFSKLEKMITRDVSMSYKILRLINSAYYRRINTISSIKQAIVIIGEKGIRRFLSLLSMAGLASNKPDELIRSSIIRAKFCELISEMNGSNVNPSEIFTLGLFSSIDAIMDDSMENLMANLPLSENIKETLVEGKGELSDFLEIAICYEKGLWKEVSEIAALLSIDEQKLPIHYMEALGWADDFSAY